ncbi:glycosyl hydrolase family 79 C-terminal domain-containing protein [Ramlibacter tataouinensis]|nr:glycosyl hydrolase family 79 C-terminal domain-containing protein [Ramlibacter tataouinensis]
MSSNHPAVPAPSPPDPTRRSLLIKTYALAGASLLPALAACGGSDGAAGASAQPPQPAPASAPQVQADVGFQSVSTAARLDSRFTGLSYEKNKLAQPLFTGSNTALIQLFRLLGPGVLRIGANAVDRSSWNGAVSGLTPILPAHVDALADFLQATQWQLIYGVNMARNTTASAADEAAYVFGRLGSSLLAWEIGNEPDLYRRNEYRPDDWSYPDFRSEWRELRSAMSAVSPGVAFSGPAVAFDIRRFTLPFARDEGDNVSLLTHHYYRADRNDPASTLALLLRPDPVLLNELAVLVSGASQAGIEQGVRLAEANSFFNGGVANVSNAFGTALWVMDFMFNCAVAGCTGVNMHGGGSGPGYTPIADRNGVVVEARPEFYGMLMFSQAAQGLPMRGLVVAPSAVINVSAWGVQRADGGRNLILINKDDSRSVRMSVVTGIAADRYEPLWLRGTALSASTGQTLGGVAIGQDGSWAPQAQPPLIASDGELNVLLPPASAVLLRSL